MSLSVQCFSLEDTDSKDFYVRQNREDVLYGFRYSDYWSVNWFANPKMSKREALKHMHGFYQKLAQTIPADRGDEYGIHVKILANTQVPENLKDMKEDAPLETFLKLCDINFVLAQINSPYGVVGLESLKTPWDVTTGRLNCTSHQPLLDILPPYICATSRSTLDETEVRQILTEAWGRVPIISSATKE